MGSASRGLTLKRSSNRCCAFYRFVGIIFLQQQGFGCNYRINIAGSLMGLFKNNCLKIFNI